MRSHLKILGWLHLGMGLLDLFLVALAAAVLAGVAAVLGVAQGPVAGLFSGGLGLVLVGLLGLTALPNLLVGWGLLKRREWAGLVALILALFNLFKFPWGTALGAYAVWVLTDERSKRLLEAP